MTLRRVAKAVGITPVAIYRHFKDRAGLLNFLADEGFEELTARLAAKRLSGDTEKRLTKLGEIQLEYALQHPRLYELMFLKPRGGARRYPQDFRAGRSPTTNPTVELIREGMESGYLRKDDACAVEALIAEGININITLMFSLAHYEAVAQAYLRGLKRNAKPHQVSSVASFFVSRVDTEVDRALEGIGTPEALSLHGKIAIANAKVVYQRFREIFLGTAFEEFRRRGARLQRPLWASTGTKNPAFSDVLYVEELIGPNTINTIPPATLNAFRDHGRVQPTLENGQQDAEQALARLAKLDVDLEAITEKLLADGITAFTHSLDELLASLKEKRSALLESQTPRKSESRTTRVA